tara:strand:+ start:491 stop:808 length:318 start_codon:yes stop_codon:yes gene_type:complete
MKKYISIITTTSTKENAKSITESILRSKLSPCVQQIPLIHSTFIWKNKIQYEDEVMLIIKAKQSNEKEIKNHIKKIHNYEIPEIISYEFDILSQKYEKWFNDQQA